jgi:hypothetical protein
MLALVALLPLLLASCTEDDPAGPAQGRAADHPIRFTSFLADTVVQEDSEITLRWRVDSLNAPMKRILFWVKDASLPGWQYHERLERLARSRTIRLAGFDESRLRFGIGFEGQYVLDSSGIVERGQIDFRVLWPTSRAHFHLGSPNVFRWVCNPDPSPGRRLLLDCARYGGSWIGVTAVPATQDSCLLDHLPHSGAGWFRLRFRLEQTNREIIIDSVAQLRFGINGVAAGDVVERGKPLDMQLVAELPETPGITAENVLTLSTDGGTTWSPITPGEYVAHPASDRCFLRYTNAHFGLVHTIGPIRIVDNTTPLFLPETGMRLRYLFVSSEAQGGVTTRSDSSWMTIDVQREEVLGDRTIYHCGITSRKSARDSTTSQGTLTRMHAGLQEISGSFLPFATFAFPSILHPDITVLNFSKVIGQPGTVGVQGKRMTVQRGLGVTSYGENTVTGVISRSGYGFSYTLE